MNEVANRTVVLSAPTVQLEKILELENPLNEKSPKPKHCTILTNVAENPLNEMLKLVELLARC